MTDRITLNGVAISGMSGKNITILSKKIIVDGKDVTPDTKEINIEIHGDIDRLNVDTCNKLLVIGNVASLTTVSGDVEVSGAIYGPVETVSGDVKCGGAIGGSVSTVSGDIKHRSK